MPIEEPAVALKSSRQTETILCRLRYVMAGLVLAMTVLFNPPSFWAALALRTLEDARRLGRLVLAADCIGAVRLPLALLWTSIAILMVAFSREFRAQEAARVTAQQERERIADGFRATISAVLTRSGIAMGEANHRDVMEAVQRICEEQPQAAQELAARVADLLAPRTAKDFGLSRREQEILSLLAQGYSYARIAADLFVSPSTVRNHVHHIKDKLDARSREEIIELARLHGLAR